MKTTLLLAMVVIAVESFFDTATAQVYDYEKDSVIAPVHKPKVYPAVILSFDDFRTLKPCSDTIPVSRQPYRFRVDSTSTYYRTLERARRLPGSERWEQYETPDARPGSGKGSGYIRRKVE